MAMEMMITGLRKCVYNINSKLTICGDRHCSQRENDKDQFVHDACVVSTET